jgi:hypothetical protein
VVGEQAAQLITGQARACDRDAEPVGVGIVGEHDVGVEALSIGQGKIEGARLLRVRERDRREVGVGLGLRGHHMHVGESGPRQRVNRDVAADAVHRRVDDPQVARTEAHHRDRSVEVRRDHLLVRNHVGVGERDPVERTHPVDGGRDLGVDRRRDLRSVAQVDLVAVVLGRVVAGGHHDAGVGAEVQHRERQNGGRRSAGEKHGVESRSGEDGGGIVGEGR